MAHLSLGNPHTVVAVEDVAPSTCEPSGQVCRRQPRDRRARARSRSALTMRVHERGAGITEACGTGACAAAWAAASWGLVPGPVGRNHRAHGRWRCQGTSRPARPGRVTLIGPATFVGHRRGRAVTGDRQEEDGAVSYDEALGATLIERAIREKIVLVGVTVPPDHDDDTEANLDELDAARRHRRRRRGGPHGATAGPARPGVLHRQGQGGGTARPVPGRRRRHGRVRQRAERRRSSTTSRSSSVAPPSTARR